MPSPETLWHDAVSTDGVPPGEVREAVVDGQILAIANIQGEYYALDGICAHQGGPLGKGNLEGCTLTCPWHGWQYDTRTGKQKLSQTIRQATFAVRVRGTRIEVCITPREG